MSEFRIRYYEPGLGWCNYIDPYPEGTVFREEAEAVQKAALFHAETGQSTEVWERGSSGSRKVWERASVR